MKATVQGEISSLSSSAASADILNFNVVGNASPGQLNALKATGNRITATITIQASEAAALATRPGDQITINAQGVDANGNATAFSGTNAVSDLNALKGKTQSPITAILNATKTQLSDTVNNVSTLSTDFLMYLHKC